MLRNWSVDRGNFDVSNRLENSSDGYIESRSLPGSYPGSFTGIEFDVEAGPVSDRESEAGSYHGPSFDWLAHALDVRERLLLKENKGAEGQEQGDDEAEDEDEDEEDEKVNNIEQSKPRTPSPDYEDFDTEKKLEPTLAAPKRGILKKNADTYELEKYKRNAMIIFNHKDFLAGVKKSREGTMRDEERLKSTFEQFGFEVESHLNLEKSTLIQKLKIYFTGYGCVCAAVLTHGSRHGYLRAFDTRYSEHEIIECFNTLRNPSLLGKPIIILIQACRGDEPATAVNPGTPKLEDEVEMDSDDHYYNLPTECDMLIFHSCYVKRASARDPRKGSWFIQTLCKQILLLAATEDFEAICKAVKKEVALEKEHYMTFNNQPVVVKQMPVVTSTLLRSLYLRKYEGDDDDETDTYVVRDEVMQYTEVTTEPAPVACGCDVYFEYMKKCLRIFLRENPADEVASSILEISQNVQNGRKYKHVKAGMANLIRNYLTKNADRFRYSEVMFLGQPCCCSASSRRKVEKLSCCCVS